ncbi:MAG: hypothetical protein HRU15_21090 [Planctomycetes bacterium]|nr:hypothetical protein [Planctomycetota bacterium]
MQDFQYRLSRIDVSSEGDCDGVAEYSLNNQTIRYCLQIPENYLYAGKNTLHIIRATGETAAEQVTRIHGSNAELIDYRETATGCSGIFTSQVPIQICIEHFHAESLLLQTADGTAIEYDLISMPDCNYDIIACADMRTVHVCIK